MSNIVNRIKEYLILNKIPISKAESFIGVANGTLSKPIKDGKTIKTDTLEKFLNVYDDFKIRDTKTSEIKSKTNVLNDPEANYHNEPYIDVNRKFELFNELFGGLTNTPILNKLDAILDNQEKILERFDRELLKDFIEYKKKQLTNKKTKQ